MLEKASKTSYKKLLLLILVLLVLFVIIILLNGKETHISSLEDNPIFPESFVCKASSLDSPFFDSSVGSSYGHEIKVLFKDGGLDAISYSFDGSFPSEQVVVSEEASLHARYGRYMVSIGQNEEKLNPVFSIMGDKLKISLYGREKDIDRDTAKLFLLTGEEFESLYDYSLKDLMMLYKNKGFECESQ